MRTPKRHSHTVGPVRSDRGVSCGRYLYRNATVCGVVQRLKNVISCFPSGSEFVVRAADPARSWLTPCTSALRSAEAVGLPGRSSGFLGINCSIRRRSTVSTSLRCYDRALAPARCSRSPTSATRCPRSSNDVRHHVHVQTTPHAGTHHAQGHVVV